MRKRVAEEIRSNPDTRKEEPDTLTGAEELSLKRAIIFDDLFGNKEEI